MSLGLLMQATRFNHSLARACKVPREKGGNMHSVRASTLALAFTAAVGFPALSQSGEISGDNVKIGVLTDMSGQFSHESGEGAVTAVRMAVEDFGGKVLGKPISLVVADHQNKNDIAIAKAREWYDVDKVDLITNLINSGI